MADEERGQAEADASDAALAHELEHLRQLLLRQQQARAVPRDAPFKRALRAQLTGMVPASPGRTVPPEWLTRVAQLLAPRLQLSLRGEAGQARRYGSDDLTITLAVTPASEPGSGGVTLDGEVEGPGYDGAQLARTSVELLRGAQVLATGRLDDVGNFILKKVPEGVYALRLRFPDQREVLIPPTRYPPAHQDADA
jgi:hypothetical protein